jgi:hypothetical protein
MKVSSYHYSATVKLKLSDGSLALFKEEYPGVTDLAISSKQFIDYNECVTSCQTLMGDLKKRINDSIEKPIYTISSEINPSLSGQPTLSKDWTAGEVGRLWIYDAAMEKTGNIHAIGQARIFSSTDGNISLLN